MIGQINIVDRIPETLNRVIPRYFITEEEHDTTNVTSVLGTPVYSNLEFLKVSGTSRDNSLEVNGADGGKDVMLRIDTVLFVVTQTKNIIITSIQGQQNIQTDPNDPNSRKNIFSTVKEYISGGDYMITINGAIMSEHPNLYPHDDVSLFIELMNLPKSIPVASNFLNLFSIGEIVVEHFEIAEKLGSRNEVPFIINCLSDFPIQFKLNA